MRYGASKKSNASQGKIEVTANQTARIRRIFWLICAKHSPEREAFQRPNRKATNLRAHIKFYLFLFVTFLLACSPASADKRVALVVGNSIYKNAPLLPNPANDAAAIAATLKGAGFDTVDVKSNLPSAEMRRALRDFADQARDADIAVVYYAGHGIEINGTNYLIPTDAALERDTDVYDEAYSLDRILLAIEPARHLRLVIVDACRNNPFSDSMKRTVTSRSVSRGLARVEPETSNTLVAFAAKAGLTAFDGNSKNSPYAEALVKHIATPGLDLRRAFGFIRDDVLKATGNRQEPFVYGSLGGEDVALVPASKPVASTPSVTPQSEIRREYELAVQVGRKDALNAFLAQRPEGYYASLAKLQLAQMVAEEARLAATEKARLAEQERTRLAAEGAHGADLDKAAADAKVTEEARIVAELTKQTAQQQTAEAERKRMMADRPAAGPIPETQIAAIEAAPGETAANPPASTAKGMSLASLDAGSSQAEITKSVQEELRRVGCLASAASGQWNAETQRALSAFNRKAGMKLNVKAVSADTLDAIRQNPSRVCPLACEHGFKADGDSCTRIVCAEGSFLNDDNECEKRRGKTPTARRDDRDHRDNRRERTDRRERPIRERTQALPEASIARPRVSDGGSPQIVCNAYGCRPVRPGCRIDYQGGSPRNGTGGNVEVCH